MIRLHFYVSPLRFIIIEVALGVHEVGLLVVDRRREAARLLHPRRLVQVQN